MQLESLILTGFKSFPEARIDFPKGITAVVGPNGTGKSNVVDAILWVLGEQSTKALRSERMEDVIFNGTESRKPVGMTEVSLVLSDVTSQELEAIAGVLDDLPGTTEIMVTRRLYRDGESEYYINKIPCRLKDIRGFFLEARAGAKGHTVIEQGNIDHILSGSPQDRRNFIEETAGIGRFKKQKTEALRKLKTTEENLVRLRDIVGEVRKQLRTLERQARQAEQYQTLQGESRSLELQLLSRDYQDFNQLKGKIESEIADYENQESQYMTEEARLMATYEEIKSEMLSDGEVLGKMKDSLRSLEQQMGHAVTTIEVERNRIQLYAQQQDQAVDEQTHLLSESQQASVTVEEIQNQLREESEQGDKQRSEIPQDLTDLRTELVTLDKSVENMRKSRDELSVTIQDLSEKIREVEQQLIEEKTDYAATASRLKTIQAVLQEEFGYTGDREGGLPSVREVCQGVKDTIGERLEVPEQIELAIEAVLGEHIRAWVVEGTSDIVKSLEIMKEHKLGRGSFIPLQPYGVKVGEPPYWWILLRGKPGVIGRAAELVRVTKELIPVLHSLLGHVVIVQDLSHAFSLIAQQQWGNSLAPVFVTLAGEVVDVSGLVSGGENAQSSGLLQRRREVLILETHITTLNQRIETQQSQNHDFLQNYETTKEHLQDLDDRLKESEMKILVTRTTLQERRDRIEADLLRMKQEEEERQDRLGNLAKNIQQFQLKSQESQAEQERADGQFQDLEQQKNTLQIKLTAVEERHASGFMKTRELEQGLTESRKKFSATRELRSKAEVQIAEVRTRLETLEETSIGTYGRPIQEVLANHTEIKLPSASDMNKADREGLRERLQVIRNRMERMGPLNLAAVQEHRELEERHQFLSKQEEDLSGSIGSLQEIIDRLSRTTNKMFEETFRGVQEKFGEVFSALFAGGHAELVLVQPEPDPDGASLAMDPGVDIVAQPPGKRLKSLAMLSGGEKALTVLALLFASFLIKPSPFCILDEVDAPLDEPNVIRFARFLAQLTSLSQFVIITHNKRTMEVADSLFGVTMEEPGISKFVSVRIGDLQKV